MGSCDIQTHTKDSITTSGANRQQLTPYPRYAQNYHNLLQHPHGTKSVSRFWLFIPQQFLLTKVYVPPVSIFHSKGLKTVFPHYLNTNQLLTLPLIALPQSCFMVHRKALRTVFVFEVYFKSLRERVGEGYGQRGRKNPKQSLHCQRGARCRP